jgi:TRAP transporter TAXI family solute receptor
MKRFGLVVLVLLLLSLWNRQERTPLLRLGSGPSGGTFQPVAKGIVQAVAPGEDRFRFVLKPSGGSSANLEDLARGNLELALVYAGDLHLASLEDLVGQPGVLDQVKVVAYLYGAEAQLVVRRSGVITRLEELRNRRVAIGSSGSGAALAAKRFFRAVGLWEEIIPLYSGYDQAMNQLGEGSVDAVWQLVGAPSPSLEATGQVLPLRFLDLAGAAREHDFLAKYPFYLPATVPAGTYSGQELELHTFQDSTLLAAAAGVEDGLIYRLLEELFADAAIDRLRRVHPVLSPFSPETAVPAPGLTLHSGAEKFWREKGLLSR